MNNFYKYYLEENSKIGTKNVDLVQLEAKQILDGGVVKQLITKINNHINRFKLDSNVNDICKKIVNDRDFASLYAKLPAKQTSSEKTQLLYLKNKGISLTNLVAGGKEALRLLDGDIIKGDDRGGKATKSFDFVRTDKNEYVFAKVTTGNGGGQDNQYRDVLDFLKQSKEYINKHNNDITFVALVDGDYYTQKRLEGLKIYECDRIKITNSDEYKD